MPNDFDTYPSDLDEAVLMEGPNQMGLPSAEDLDAVCAERQQTEDWFKLAADIARKQGKP